MTIKCIIAKQDIPDEKQEIFLHILSERILEQFPNEEVTCDLGDTVSFEYEGTNEFIHKTLDKTGIGIYQDILIFDIGS